MLIGNNYNLKVKQLNVKTSFLYGYQKDTVYVQQHEDFLKFKKELILFYFFGKNYCRTLKMVHTQEIWWSLKKDKFLRCNYDNFKKKR